MQLTIVAGARPNFMKIAPIIKAIHELGQEMITYRLIHTGQHFDHAMSETFFKELNIPEPHVNLACGGGTQAEQTAAIMVAFEKELIENPSDLVLVVGDVTSTLACSIVAKKLQIKVMHVEAGIRSGDLTMPEEINRLVTDSITDYFFTTTLWASENLLKAGVALHQIFFVGNVMIDTLLQNRERFQQPNCFELFDLKKSHYLVLTLHRPSNVDDANGLIDLLEDIALNVSPLPLIFPIHPRTKQKLPIGWKLPENLKLIEPLGYLQFNYLVQLAKGVITDSGGITEETTVMGIPCLTLRNSTERPETVEVGTNELVGDDRVLRNIAIKNLLNGKWKKGAIPEKWDGHAAKRIVEHLLELNTKIGKESSYSL